MMTDSRYCDKIHLLPSSALGVWSRSRNPTRKARNTDRRRPASNRNVSAASVAQDAAIAAHMSFQRRNVLRSITTKKLES